MRKLCAGCGRAKDPRDNFLSVCVSLSVAKQEEELVHFFMFLYVKGRPNVIYIIVASSYPCFYTQLEFLALCKNFYSMPIAQCCLGLYYVQQECICLTRKMTEDLIVLLTADLSRRMGNHNVRSTLHTGMQRRELPINASKNNLGIVPRC